ncbi:MAG: hypothetical protein WBG90_10200 [Saonia sp.]
MDEKRIGQIVRKVFEKARKECVTHTKNGLCRHVEKEIDLSYKTLERAYEKYEEKQKSIGLPTAESVNFFCRYLGYDSYKDYVLKIRSKRKWIISISISIAFGAILLIALVPKNSISNNQIIPEENRCMTWADSLYIKVSCTTKPYSKYGTKIEPLDQIRLKNFKQVKVTMATQFFAEETNKPLIWYHKTKDGEIEYFTAPGLHPITEKTLDEITEYIIQKYVPLHSK